MTQSMMSRFSRRSLAAALLGAAALAAGTLTPGCAPQPRNVPCSNDAQCAETNEDFRYCLQSRCVECVSSSGCGAGSLCDSGECRAAR